MLNLNSFLFTAEYEIDRIIHETGSVTSTEFDKHNKWKEEMIDILQEIADKESSWNGMAKFHIVCAPYCLLDSSTEDEPVSEVVFAICDTPEEDTFKLDGLNLKFLGTNRMEVELKSVGDCNILVPIFPYGYDD